MIRRQLRVKLNKQQLSGCSSKITTFDVSAVILDNRHKASTAFIDAVVDETLGELFPVADSVLSTTLQTNGVDVFTTGQE